MSQETARTRFYDNITTIVGLLFASLTIIGLFTEVWLLVAGFVGLMFLTPLVALLVGDRAAIEEWWGEEKAEQYEPDSANEDPLETVKRRYAAGDLTEEEFEHRLQQLLAADHAEMSQSPHVEKEQHVASEGTPALDSEDE